MEEMRSAVSEPDERNYSRVLPEDLGHRCGRHAGIVQGIRFAAADLHRLSEGLVALLSDFHEVRMERERGEMLYDSASKANLHYRRFHQDGLVWPPD